MNIPPYGDQLKKLNSHLMTLKVLPQTAPNMTVKINPGSYWFDDASFVDFQGANTKPLTIPTSGAKFIIVGLSKQGSVELIEGAAGTNPILPKLKSGVMPLAAIALRANTTMITEENIFDIRQVFQSPNFVTTHNNIGGRDANDAHPISSITNLQNELDDRVKLDKLEEFLTNKSDSTGTNEQTFTLNKDEIDVPLGRCSFIIGRGTESDVAITWDEGLNRWVIDEDVQISSPEKGFLLTSAGGSIFRITASDSGLIGLQNIDNNESINILDQNVKADATDINPGTLADKVDGTTLEVNTTTHKMGVKSNTFEAHGAVRAHESNYNHSHIGKVKIDATDELPGTLTDKVDNNTLEVNSQTKKLQIKDSSDYVKKITDSDIEITDITKGIIMHSPDGTRYRITVANGGALVTTKL